MTKSSSIILCGLLGVALGAGCTKPGGLDWAESRLGKQGAVSLLTDAEDWVRAHPTAPTAVDPATARCPSPRAVFDLYARDQGGDITMRVEYSRVSKRGVGEATIHGVDDVRCLVLVAHSATTRRHSIKERMAVRLVDRAASTEQGLVVDGNDEDLTALLAAWP